MVDLKKELQKKGYNENRFAIKMGVSRQAINSIVHGARPSIELAKKMAKELNINWVDFYD